MNRHDSRLYLQTDRQWCCDIKNCDEWIYIRKRNPFDNSRLTFVAALWFIYGWIDACISMKWRD